MAVVESTDPTMDVVDAANTLWMPWTLDLEETHHHHIHTSSNIGEKGAQP
jgi:hypothetical protein